MFCKKKMPSPTEMVYENGNVNEIKLMLDKRWEDGWQLDRIIKHAKDTKGSSIYIYYFVGK